MISISDDILLQLNRLGLIPGPMETEDAFDKRAQYCLDLKTLLSKELVENLNANDSAAPEVLQNANKQLANLYDISPTWVPLFFSNYKLAPWHGGCAWIFQVSEELPTSALIQLRRRLERSPTYLGLYQRDELLMHEQCHVGRMLFQEPQFEEIFAYNTSSSKFRQWFGPLLQSSTESVIFILTLFIIVVFDFFLITSHRHDAYIMALWLKAIPLTLFLYALWRLHKRRKILSKCLKNLSTCLQKNFNAMATTFRLTDKEITLFADFTPEEIRQYAEKISQTELRWKVIYKAYF